MTNPRDPDGSTRITGPSSAGATPPAGAAATPSVTERTTTTHTPTRSGHDVTGRMTGTAPAGRTGGEHGLGAHKTSAAAAFALVFGVAALFCALTGILSFAAVVLGLIGIVLGIAGLKMSKRPGVTGHGVAVGGLVTAVLGLLLGGAVLAGLAAIVNSEGSLDRISNQIDDLRSQLPSGDQITDTVQQ